MTDMTTQSVRADTRLVLDALADSIDDAREAQVRQLDHAACWADVNGPETMRPGSLGIGEERILEVGGEGTPEVAEFALAELAVVAGLSTMQGRWLVADALDLRHRLPLIWRGLHERRLPVEQARFVARRTRSLSREAAAMVDRSLVDALGGMSWSAFVELVDARIVAADPVRAEQERELRRTERCVRVGRSVAGSKTIFARASTEDAVWFDATVDRLADLLDSGQDSKDVRRARALGVLARPHEALQLLAEGAKAASQSGDSEPVLEGTEPDPDDGGPGGLGLSSAGLDQLLSALAAMDAAKLLPPVRFFFHLSEESITGRHAVVRSEHDGPLPLRQLVDFLKHLSPRVTVTPVLDQRAAPSVHAYEIPERLAELARVIDPVEVFPYGTTRSRRCDLDHSEPWQNASDGPPQTRIDNLGPLGRGHHRLKTHGGWQHVQTRSGAHWWRTKNGYVVSVVDGITKQHGNNYFAQMVWEFETRPDD